MGRASFRRAGAASMIARVLCAISVVAVASVALAAPPSASSWVVSSNSKVRLVSGKLELDGKPVLVAGVQLRLNPGWKTYWKNPGESGVPPSFDWAGSKNLKRAELLYPAPHRFADANGTAIGYEDEVTFPVKLTPEREGEPIELKLSFDYGLCKDLCVPNDVSLDLVLPSDIGKGDASLIETALLRVPREAAPESLPKIAGVESKLDGESPELVVDAFFPARATGTDLFIDGGDVFVPVPKALGPVVDGRQRFAVTFASPKEAADLKGKVLALTLVSHQGSTETKWKAK